MIEQTIEYGNQSGLKMFILKDEGGHVKFKTEKMNFWRPLKFRISGKFVLISYGDGWDRIILHERTFNKLIIKINS